MIINIFSNFDPAWFNLHYTNIIALSIIPVILISRFWYLYRKLTTTTIPITLFIIIQLKRTKSINLKISSLIITTLFLSIIYFNTIGILPYIFSISSHIIVTLSISLPIWLTLVLRRSTYSPKKTIGHLLPDRAPLWLNPFLVIIETIRIIVRPITLRFRLAANITAGHIVLSLITSFSISINIKTFLLYIITINIYILFELAICLIQAYIFCLLISLYSNDHS